MTYRENTNNEPLFSIIIANYNNGQYLKECIDSIIAQTYTNWEVILVDDCSTDNSQEIYKSFVDNKKIKVLYNNINRGVGYTKKRAADNASGKYIGIVDPDDKIIPETLKIVVAGFKKHTNAAIVYTNHFVCDKDLNIMNTSTKNGKIPEGESQLSYNGPKIGPFWAFNKSNYIKTEGFNPIFKSAEDQDLYYKLEEVGNIIFIDKPCYYYRYHSGGISTTSNFFSAYYNNLKAMKIANKRRKTNNINIKPLSNKDFASRWLFYYQGYSLRLLRNGKNAKALIQLLKSLKFILYDQQLLSIRIIFRYIILKQKVPIEK